MRKKTTFTLLILALLAASSLQSCGIFKRGCDCPSVHGGKQR